MISRRLGDKNLLYFCARMGNEWGLSLFSGKFNRLGLRTPPASKWAVDRALRPSLYAFTHMRQASQYLLTFPFPTARAHVQEIYRSVL